MRNDVHVRALQRAVDLIGVPAVAQRLRVTEEQVQRWLAGDWPMSLDAFSDLVDLLLDYQVRSLGHTPPTQPGLPEKARG